MRHGLTALFAASALAAQSPDSLFRARRFDEARAAYKAQLATNNRDANAMFWLGRIADQEKKTGEAIDWFEKAVKLDDNNALYHFYLGGVLGDAAQHASKLRQPFLARRVKSEFERAVVLDPKMIGPRLGLVDFYGMAPGFMGGSPEKAREQVAAVTKLNPMRGHLAEARIANRDKDLVAEERALQAAVTAAPDSAQSYFILAQFYRRLSKWDDAFATYDRLMKAKPDEIVAHLGWGAISALSGKSYERGERELKQFMALATVATAEPQNLAGAHFRLGQILEKTNRRDQARSEYSEALKVNPQHLEAKKALDALK